MNLQQLVYFRTVARLEHMTKAAEFLHISQPSLTSTIRRLEEVLGAELFEQQGRNIKLSDFGNAFLPYAEAAINDLEEGQRVVDSLKKKTQEAVRLVTPPIESYPGLLEELLSCCPSLVISNAKDYSDIMLRKLKDGIIDLCISANIFDNKALSWTVLSENGISALLSASDPLAKKTSLSFEDLKNSNFSMFPKHTGAYRQIEQYCISAGYYPKVAFTSERLSDVISSVLPCKSIAIIISGSENSLPDKLKQGLVCIPFKQSECKFVRRLYWRSNEKRNSILSVKDIICDYFQTKNGSLEPL